MPHAPKSLYEALFLMTDHKDPAQWRIVWLNWKAKCAGY